jgi:ubiquinone/menaquinone biosynthesis C-methylase UbiE
MVANMDDNLRTRQLDENDRLMRALVELRHQHIESATDSALSYDELHIGGQLRQRDSFYKWLMGLLQPRAGESLLDVSCGQGTLLRLASEAGLQATGIDLSFSAVAIAVKQIPCTAVSVANAEHLPYPDNVFHYATNVGSLEHYFHPHWAIREMSRVLRPDGLALILLPNTFGLLGNIIHVCRNGDVFDDDQPLQRYGTNGQWRRLLETNGLEVAQTVKYEREWPRTWQDMCWYVHHPHRLGRVLLTYLIPVNLSSFLVYLCQKAC